MKNIQNKLFVILFISLAFPYPGASQGSSTNELKYEVNRIYPYISIPKETLNKAQTLADINARYKSSWVREYISVEILTSYKGKIRKAISKNDTLSQEQKEIINRADAGTDISVNIRYLPENTLKQNDIKENNFTFSVDPEKEAKYSGGQQQLQQYLKDNAIDKIPAGSFKDYDLTAIKFTINEDGHIIDAHVFEPVIQTSNNEKIDDLLLEAIRKMPCWEPAEFSDGTNVKQEFVLTVGNMENCVVSLLNIRRH